MFVLKPCSLAIREAEDSDSSVCHHPPGPGQWKLVITPDLPLPQVVTSGNTVRLPCIVDTLQGSVTQKFWGAIIFGGQLLCVANIFVFQNLWKDLC